MDRTKIKESFPELKDSQVDRVLELINQSEDTTVDAIMNELNTILDGYGVEVVRVPIDDTHHGILVVAEYVNMGDMYATTILYEYGTGEFVAIDWAGWMERREYYG